MHARQDHTRATPATPNRAWLLDQLYPLPDPLRSEEDWRRHAHADLADATREELTLELDRLRDRLRHDRQASRWLYERLARVEGALSHVR